MASCSYVRPCAFEQQHRLQSPTVLAMRQKFFWRARRQLQKLEQLLLVLSFNDEVDWS